MKLDIRYRANDAILLALLAATAAFADSKPHINRSYGNLPLIFEKNEGQTDGRVDFLARGAGYALFLTPTEAVLRLGGKQPSAIRMKVVGANRSAKAEAGGQLPGRSNYFIGEDKSKWRTDVPHFSKVRYRNIYRGIDLVYYGKQRQLEYDFVVSPGADPSAIRLKFEGVQSLRVDADGDLLLATGSGETRFHKPVVYQESDGVRHLVEGRYRLLRSKQVRFEVGEYRKDLPLVIDPVLSYSTYLGGSGSDQANAIAVDASGNAYVAGSTESTNFPTIAGALDTSHNGSTDILFPNSTLQLRICCFRLFLEDPLLTPPRQSLLMPAATRTSPERYRQTSPHQEPLATAVDFSLLSSPRVGVN